MTAAAQRPGIPPAGHGAHRSRVHGAARPRAAGRRADRGVRPRGRAGRRRGGDPALPWLVYFQGGPGFGSPRPFGRESWLNRALDDYRVLLLDQRGTGRSTPASRHTLGRLGTPAAQAGYLGHFRADSIVRDAELIRRQLIGDEPWSVLGQSFGGFCTTTYLSLAPEGMREALVTGGLPGLDATADDVYRLTYPIVAERNRLHYERFPHGRRPGPGRRPSPRQPRGDHAGRRAAHRAGLPEPGPDARRRQRQRHPALPAGGGVRRASALRRGALRRVPGPRQCRGCRSPRRRCTPWSTRRATRRARRHAGRRTGSWPSSREFDPAAAVDGDITLLFTGEMIYPWMFETDPVLRPLRDAAGGTGRA